jgi:transcriptional regulator with XRE-family HTH domain
MARDGDLEGSTMSVDLRAKWPIVALDCPSVAITGQQIKRERRRRGMRQVDLAEAADVGQRTIGRIERGEVEDPRSLEAVAAVLGLLTPDVDDAREGKLLSDASMYDLLQRAQELYDAATRRANEVSTYKAGAPDPDEPGMIAGPTKRTDQMNRRSQPGKATHP